MAHKCCIVDATCQRRQNMACKIQELKERVNSTTEIYHKAYGDPLFSDFQIKAGDTTFHVSKLALALRSEVFEQMFRSEMKEVQTGVMELDDGPEEVKAMLKFIHLNKKVKGSQLAKKVVPLAHRYEIEELKDQCELEILKDLTLNDAQSSLVMAMQLELSLLTMKCYEFLYYNFNGYEKPMFAFTPDRFMKSRVHGFSEHIVTNGSNMKVAYQLYSCEPFLRRTTAVVLKPWEEATMSASGICTSYLSVDAEFRVYYAKYDGGFDADLQVHLLTDACYLPLKRVISL